MCTCSVVFWVGTLYKKNLVYEQWTWCGHTYSYAPLRYVQFIQQLMGEKKHNIPAQICSMGNPTGYSIFLDFFGGITTFHSEMLQSVRSCDMIYAMFFPVNVRLHDSWNQSEVAGMGVQPFLWRVPTAACLRAPGRSAKLGLSARSSSSRRMQIQRCAFLG